MATPYRKRRRRSLTYDTIIFYITTIIVSVALVAFFLTFVGYRTVVDGESMEPTLRGKESVFVSKLHYRMTEPKRFDVVVFRKPEESERLLVKRIIGLPGDSIRISNGKVYLNNRLLVRDDSKDGYTVPIDMEEELTLDQTHYFVMGDNRNNSMDSRDERIGLVSRDRLIGKVLWCMYPFSRVRAIN